MIRDLTETIGDTVFGTVGRAVGRTQEKRQLPVDLLESDEAYLAIFDAPGVQSSDIQITFENGVVSVQFDRYRDMREGFEMVFPGRGLALDGRVELPEDATVDPNEATATLKADGTLHVQVPKVDEGTAETNSVEIEDEANESETDGDETE